MSDRLKEVKEQFDTINNSLFDKINAYKAEQTEKYKAAHPELSQEELDAYNLEDDETNEEYI